MTSYIDAFPRLQQMMKDSGVEAKEIYPIQAMDNWTIDSQCPIFRDLSKFKGRIIFYRKISTNVIKQFDVYFYPIEYSYYMHTTIVIPGWNGKPDFELSIQKRKNIEEESDWRLTTEEEDILIQWYNSI